MEINFIDSTPVSETWVAWVMLSLLITAGIGYATRHNHILHWLNTRYTVVGSIALVSYALFFQSGTFAILQWLKICALVAVILLMRLAIAQLVKYVFGPITLTIQTAIEWIIYFVTLDILPIMLILYIVKNLLQ